MIFLLTYYIMTVLTFTSKEQLIIDAYETAATASDVTSSDVGLQTAYVAFIKMLNAKVSLHRGFVYLNRFLNHVTTDLTTEFFTEMNENLEAYIGYITSGDYANARESHNWIISQLDDAGLFLSLERTKDFDASLFSVAENTDGTTVQTFISQIDDTGEPVFVAP
jgi:hypothetical protein